MSVVASYTSQIGRVEPYLSLDEVKFSPTANGIDFTNLIEDASANVQDRALSELITRASSEADVYCMGRLGTLNATQNTESEPDIRPSRQGEMTVRPYYTPIISIDSFSMGWGPGDNLTPVTISSSNCFIGREFFRITAGDAMGLSYGGLGIVGARWSYQTPYYVQYTYTNGWPNSFTAAQASAGATSIVLQDATGIHPGMQLTIWDGQMDELVTVDSTYTTGTTIPLTSALKYKHGVGVNVSTLPATVKQAVIHLVVAMIKQRGQGGLVLNEIGEPGMVSAKTESSVEDKILGLSLLDEFMTMWSQM